ncbi:hypothetical protein Tco_0881654 [Tanacetum coccineum]
MDGMGRGGFGIEIVSWTEVSSTFREDNFDTFEKVHKDEDIHHVDIDSNSAMLMLSTEGFENLIALRISSNEM